MDAGDGAVDITDARLVVVGGMAGVGPGEGAAIGLEDTVAVYWASRIPLSSTNSNGTVISPPKMDSYV